MGLTPAIWSLLEFRKTLYILKNVSKPTQELIDHILRFSTNFVSESARLAQVWVWEQGVVTLCWGSWVNQPLYLVCRPLRALVACRQRQRPFVLVWSGVDIFVRGTWRPQSWWTKCSSCKIFHLALHKSLSISTIKVTEYPPEVWKVQTLSFGIFINSLIL